MPDASTKACRGLIIMSGVGTTYMIGGTFGYLSGNHNDTGMLYFAPCTCACAVLHRLVAKRVLKWRKYRLKYLIVHRQCSFCHQQRYRPAVCMSVLLNFQDE